MSEVDDLFEEIKQQSIETRNVVIKSDNVVKNLSVDIRNLQKQLANYQSKGRWFILVGYFVIVLILGFGAYWVTQAQTKAAKRHLAEKKNEYIELQKQFTAFKDEAARYKAANERKQSAKQNAEKLAAEILTMIEQKQEREAVLKARLLDLDQLGPVSRPYLKEHLDEVKVRQSEAAYRSGKLNYDRKLYPKAISELELSLELMPDASFAVYALYYLAQSFSGNQDRERAVQAYDEFVKKNPRHSLADDALYHKAQNCERWKMMECAENAWQDILTSYATSSFASVARKRIKSIQKKKEKTNKAE